MAYDVVVRYFNWLKVSYIKIARNKKNNSVKAIIIFNGRHYVFCNFKWLEQTGRHVLSILGVAGFGRCLQG